MVKHSLGVFDFFKNIFIDRTLLGNIIQTYALLEETIATIDTCDKKIVHISNLGGSGFALVVACPTSKASLVELTVRESYPCQVPVAIRKIVGYLEGKLNTEGIFRLPGSTDEINMLQDLLDSGHFWGLDLNGFEVFSVATLLKRFFKQLPVPLLKIPMEFSAPGMDMASIVSNMISDAPKEHQIVLHFLVNFMHKARKADNRMTSKNLSLMFAPAIFGDFPDSSPEQFQALSPISTKLTKYFIQTSVDLLFPVRILKFLLCSL
jgi:hypothetical protein